MSRRIKGIGVVVALLAATLMLPTQAAYAADDCGSGWFKESDGYFTKDGPWEGAGNRNAWIYHSGKVRFCTQDDRWPRPNDKNRKVLIGYPSGSYPLESWVFKNGAYAKFCVRQFIKVYITGVKGSESYSISGSLSKDSAGVSASYSATYDRLTVNLPGAGACGKAAEQLKVRTSGIRVSGTNDSAEVQWVELSTRLKVTYWRNGTKHAHNHWLTERDVS